MRSRLAPIAVLWLASSLSPVLSQPASLVFNDCFSDLNATQKLQISTVYAQVLPGSFLNLTVLGNAPVQIVSASNDTMNPVATTLFTTSNMLTFTIWNNHSYFCSTLRPQSPLPQLTSFCPLQPGPFAFVSSINLGSAYELATFNSRLRALDPYTTELFCIDVSTTALKPGPVDSVYGDAVIIFWTTICLAIAYWLLVGVARIVSAWGRGLDRSTSGPWRRVHSAGFIFASALSGEKLANSPALLRFCTPSLRDIIFHSQWCAALGMIAIRWPQFVYPLLSQTAWSMLSYNVTITQKYTSGYPRWNPLSVLPYTPPPSFAGQLSDPNSPLFIDQAVPNTIFTLPPGVTTGMPAFAAAVGLHPADLFGITLTLFLGICGAAMLLSLFVWLVDQITTALGGSLRSSGSVSGIGTRIGSPSKDLGINGVQSPQPPEENRSMNGHLLFRTSRFLTPARWRWRTGFSSFHGSVLQGNLIRVLVLFHFPVTIFSCYQMTAGRSHASLSSIALAALSFACFSVIVPVILVFRLYITNTSKLYDETWTLLALGPLYNHYRHGSQLFACLLFATNLAFGITIGCGQKSGSVQVILILIIEIISALGTSFWLPWGQGASMGLISFLFCVARIVIAVLMVILTPVVGLASGAGQWVAYAILIILALVYLAFFMMLLVKLLESLVRIFGRVGFHKSRHVVDSGLFGAINLAGCCGSRKKAPPLKKRENVEAHRVADLQLTLDPALMHKPQMATPSNSAPPSVLRPEHAFQPYREESDDEDGFIMGAWHSFSRPAYATLDDQSPLDPPKSGFMRVGGGRSHYDTPYAIQSGSTTTFPSAERHSTTNSAQSRLSSSVPIHSSIDAARQNLSPPSTIAHSRTKSQTAVIEDPSSAAIVTDAGHSRVKSLPPECRVSDDDVSVVFAQPKRKPWYQILRHRQSDGNINITADEKLEPISDSAPGRSFVVVRKGQQSPSGPVVSGSSSGDPEQSTSKRSFVVLRE